jgi:ABC-type dipeptide/oligopeptide/nickel transport system ATPase component
MNETILEVRNLETRFFTDDGVVQAVDDVSFSMARRETWALSAKAAAAKA